MVGNVIQLMCRSPKSRAGCHFGAAIGLRLLLEGVAPTIPTGRTISIHSPGESWAVAFDVRKEGGKLVPKPTGDDPHEDEAYLPWQIETGQVVNLRIVPSPLDVRCFGEIVLRLG